MITDARSFLFLIGSLTQEEVLESGVEALKSLVDGWRSEILSAPISDQEKVTAAIYQGALLGIQIAARGRALAAKRIAQDLNIKLDEEEN